MKHSEFSPSSAFRWLKCPASLKIEQSYVPVSNKYADEGIKAHNYAAKALMCKIKLADIPSEEMQNAINGYCAYISDICDEINPLNIETCLNFSNVISGGFGTIDFYHIKNNIAHVIDFKYGIRKIEVTYNPQLILYAAAILQKYKYSKLKTIKRFCLHIYQPRIANIKHHNISIEELKYCLDLIKLRAYDTLKLNPEYNVGEHCTFCLHKTNCKSFNTHINNLIDENNKIKLLKNASLIRNYLTSLENEYRTRLMEGEEIDGINLKKPKRVRQWKEGIEFMIKDKYPELFYTYTKLISITKAQDILDPDILENLVYKKQFKSSLVFDEK